MDAGGTVSQAAGPRTLRSIDQLVDAGLVSHTDRSAVEAVAARYAVAITPAMAALIDPTDANDPIAAQFVPRGAELDTRPEELADPIGDAAHSPLPGIVHRYADRVLLKLTHVCPVYCRFCFRREMVGPGGLGALDGAEFDAAMAYIAANPAIFEVIVTGGDPFILNPRRIAEVTQRLAAIPHVGAIRWHTRVPVVQPEAITAEFVSALRVSGKAVYVALHANHARELTQAACTAIARLVDAGIVLLSQTVLLAGVNDDAATMEALLRGFIANRIKPYYLHHGDLAPGTAHFRISFAEGLALMAALRTRLSGIGLPAYVIDIPGGFGKVPVEWARQTPEGWMIRDRNGREHRYPAIP